MIKMEFLGRQFCISYWSAYPFHFAGAQHSCIPRFDWSKWPSRHDYPIGRLCLAKTTTLVLKYSQLGPYPPRVVIGLVVMLPFVRRYSPTWPSRHWLALKASNLALFTIGVWFLLGQTRLHYLWGKTGWVGPVVEPHNFYHPQLPPKCMSSAAELRSCAWSPRLNAWYVSPKKCINVEHLALFETLQN